MSMTQYTTNFNVPSCFAPIYVATS